MMQTASELLFVARPPSWWTIAFFATMIAFGAYLWQRANNADLGGVLRAARVGIVLLVIGGTAAFVANTRHGVRVLSGGLEVMPRFSRETRAYGTDQIRFYDVMTHEVGEGVRSDLEEGITIGFDDGFEITLLARTPNFERLREWLGANGIHQRSPLDRPPLRP